MLGGLVLSFACWRLSAMARFARVEPVSAALPG
jgi:hypothetical protein